MKKYYTRACNFYYGSISKEKIKKKLALPLNGKNLISFDREENGNLHITMVKTYFFEGAVSTGILGELNFKALDSGETELNFLNQNCEFYNSLGEIIDIPNLEFENISIKIN